MIYRAITIMFLSLITALLPIVVSAAEMKNKGLSVSPLRYEISRASGKTATGSIGVGNLTDKSMKVELSIKQFSMTDYLYDYRFRQVEYDWVKLKDSTVELQPGKSTKVQYDVTIPTNAATGGYYYAIFASTKDGINTVQAASLLYLTVNGDKVTRSSAIQNEKVPMFITGAEIPYEFDVKNSGNVHFNGYFFARLDGLLGKQAENGINRMSLPNTMRSINGAVPAPFLPGIYKLTYGYNDGSSQVTTTKSAYIIFIPPWSVVALLLIVLTGSWLLQKKRRKR